MTEIRAFQPQYLPQMTQVINWHINILIPAWGLPSEIISSHIEKNPEQPVIDPWVSERKTLCAFSGETLVAAAHLLRYGDAEPVSESYRNKGDIAWFVFYPEFKAEAGDLLNACHAQMKQWHVKSLGLWDSGLYIPCSVGISENWPHLGKLFYEAGYRPNPERQEAVFGGGFESILALARQEPKWTLERQEREGLKRYSAQNHGEIAYCLFDMNLAVNKPALAGWAELCEIWVDAAWRRQGVGTFLLREMSAYLVQEGYRRIVFSVAIDDEKAGAGAFYRSLGWDAISPSQDAWEYEGQL
jgi:GNAT superfamily N-acetyltransferase